MHSVRVFVWLRNLTLAALTLLFLLPFYLLLRNALMSDAQITAPTFTLWPNPPQWANLREASDQNLNLGLGLRNSALVATLQTAGLVLISAMAGWGLARVPSRYAGWVLGFIVGTMLIPGAALFMPQYLLVAKLGWINTLHGLVVPGLFSAFSTFMFRQFYLDFPQELEDAGRVDGLGHFGVFRYLALPNSKGIALALGIIAFIGSWNSFLWPLVIGQSPQLWTVQVMMSALLTAQTVNLHQLFLASLIAISPLVLLFLLLQRWIVEGVKLSGAKG